MNTIRAWYEVTSTVQQVSALAQSICWEQSVEVPPTLLPDPLRSSVLAEVADITPVGGDRYRIELHYPAELCSGQLGPLLNLLFGNVSIFPNVKLVDFTLPDALRSWMFRGPNHGARGVREVLEVGDRPMLATALKPRGSELSHLVAIAGEFVRGGGDIIKDDHNITEPDIEAFKRRVSAIQESVDEANGVTGGCAVYLPHVHGPYAQLLEMAQFLGDEGVVGALICPFLVGFENTRELLASFPLLSMAHPAFSGSYVTSSTQGWSHALLYGKFMRLLGIDMSVFPNHGGRFSFSREECIGIADALRQPLSGIPEALPCPAGGMQLDDMTRMRDDYGKDAVFLVGGALLGGEGGVGAATAAFLKGLSQ